METLKRYLIFLVGLFVNSLGSGIIRLLMSGNE